MIAYPKATQALSQEGGLLSDTSWGMGQQMNMLRRKAELARQRVSLQDAGMTTEQRTSRDDADFEKQLLRIKKMQEMGLWNGGQNASARIPQSMWGPSWTSDPRLAMIGRGPQY